MILMAHPSLGILLPCPKKSSFPLGFWGIGSKFSPVQIPGLDLTGTVLLNLD